MNNKSQLDIPINLVTIFQLITITLFFCGPVKRKLINPLLDLVYLTAVIISLRWGYISYVRSKRSINYRVVKTCDIKVEKTFNKKDKRKYDIICLLYIATSALMMISRTGSLSFSLSVFSNLGAAYYNRGNTILALERIIVLFAPISTMFIPYGMMNWRQVNRKRKTFFIIALLFRVFVDVLQGVNKSFADLIIFVMIYGIYIYAKSTVEETHGSLKFKKVLIRIWFVIGICFALFLLFFSMNIMSRTVFEINRKSSGFEYFISYLTEGYQAVDYSLTQPFTSTYGVGNSLYLLSVIDSNDLLNRTYLMKNEIMYGWNHLVNWSTVYVWIGNDVSMFGVIPVMFLIGRLFAKTWMEALYERQNLASLIIAGLLFQLCIYSSANNQIVQIQPAFVGTWFWLLYWLFMKKVRFVIRKKG